MSGNADLASNASPCDAPDAYAVLPCPRVIQIETTTRCNLRCRMCAAKGGRREGAPATREDMPEALYERILSQLEPFADGVETLSLFMDGEPLLDKRLPSFIRMAKTAGFRTVNIATNGVLLRGNTAEALIDSGLDSLIVSIDSLDPEVYASIRIGADLQTVSDNVRQFMALREAKGRALPHVCVRMIEMPENRGEQEAFKTLWRNIVDEVRFQPCHNWGSSLGGQPCSDTQAPPCNWPFRNMVIYSDGRAGFCCLDFEGIYDLGNFQNQSFDEIWHGPAYQQVREWMMQRDAAHLPKCRNCNFPSVAPLQSRHWKILMMINQTGDRTGAVIETEQDGETKRSAVRTIEPGRVLSCGILYEGQPGVTVRWGDNLGSAQWVPFHPAQICVEIQLDKKG